MASLSAAFITQVQMGGKRGGMFSPAGNGVGSKQRAGDRGQGAVSSEITPVVRFLPALEKSSRKGAEVRGVRKVVI